MACFVECLEETRSYFQLIYENSEWSRRYNPGFKYLINTV